MPEARWLSLSIDKYNTFMAVANRGSFSGAAETLNIAVATVSRHIASLEKEMDVTLFDRLPNGVRLTMAGERRLLDISRLVKSYYALLAQGNSEQGKKLLVFSVPPINHLCTSELLKAFNMEYPDITVEVLEDQQTYQALEEGWCELGFIGNRHKLSPLLQCTNLSDLRLCIVLPAKHPLATRESLSLTELVNEDFIFPEPEVKSYLVFMDACRKCGFTPRIKQTMFQMDSGFFFVSNNQGIILSVKEAISLFNTDGCVFVPLTEEFYLGGGLARRKDRPLSPAADTFWRFVSERSL